jgi:hypothetical protein
MKIPRANDWLIVSTALTILQIANIAPATSEQQQSGTPDRTQTSTPSTPVQGGLTHQSPMWQAEEWVLKRTSPWLLPGDAVKEKEQHKGPVRHFVKSVAKGTAKELGTSLHHMGQDMVFVFSCQDDLDPYDKSAPPSDKPAIVLKFNLVDGTACYLRRFPDGSYAMEDGFVDGTVIVPDEKGTYLVKYPNGARGKLVRKTDGTIEVHRPDNSITTFSKTSSGGYTARNSTIGYMGEARPDRTGVHYELGEW